MKITMALPMDIEDVSTMLSTLLSCHVAKADGIKNKIKRVSLRSKEGLANEDEVLLDLNDIATDLVKENYISPSWAKS